MRQLVILTQMPRFLKENVTSSQFNEGIILPIIEATEQKWQFIPFSNAKTLLGKEYPFAFFCIDSTYQQVNFHLDVFAILAGTIQTQGVLYLICSNWENIEQLEDKDALRWNDNKVTTASNFYQYLKANIKAFGFSVQQQELTEVALPSGQISSTICKLTADQQNIYQNLPLANQDIHLITAPRGRGKSTLSARLATQIAQTNSVVITARSHATFIQSWKNTNHVAFHFIAPDLLLQQIENKAISPHQWLFIEEAATLPLPLLHQFCHYFDKVVLTTTTQNYEGTGRGFALKFLPPLTRSYQHWQLTEPLRWKSNDPLEAFINQLLLLENKHKLDLPKALAQKIDFYTLLADSHYKTTPTDLRRLLDGNNQECHYFNMDNQLIGGIWAMNEGGLDPALTEAIWRGERRPAGNLVAQYLCFQANLPEACLLNSVRISRIAIAPHKQRQGFGKRLISEFILQKHQQKSPLVDFISVSFGMTNELLHFWQQSGFQLVQITPTKEASSGYPSAMMLYPTSKQGELFCKNAVKEFERNQKLMMALEPQDWQNLHGFAYAKRTFSACYPSLKRLSEKYPELLTLEMPKPPKHLIEEYRMKVQKILTLNNFA